MMNYILDTDICIYWFKGFMNIKNMVHKISPERIKISIFTLAELKYGAYHSQNIDKNIMNIVNFLLKVEVVGFDALAADIFGKIKAELRRTGMLLEDFDILIASTVLSHGGILVTNNVDHFQRIPNLSIENWVNI